MIKGSESGSKWVRSQSFNDLDPLPFVSIMDSKNSMVSESPCCPSQFRQPSDHYHAATWRGMACGCCPRHSSLSNMSCSSCVQRQTASNHCRGAHLCTWCNIVCVSCQPASCSELLTGNGGSSSSGKPEMQAASCMLHAAECRRSSSRHLSSVLFTLELQSHSHSSISKRCRPRAVAFLSC